MRTARRLLHALVLGAAVVATVVVPASTAVADPASPQSLTRQITAAESDLDKVVDDYDGVNQKLQDNQKSEASLQKQMAPALAAAQSAQTKVGQIATQAYKAGPVSSLDALISSGDTSQMLNALGAMNQVATSQKQQLATLSATIDAYNTKKTKLDTLIATETVQRKSLAAQKTTIKAKIKKLYALRQKAYGSSTVKASGTSGNAPSYPGRGGKVVKFAYAQLGKPYVWAADGPGSYDCSGLVLAAYRTVGVTLYHQTTVQWGEMTHISRSNLEPGDVVFYQAGSIHHVAIYIGNGKVIHAPTEGDHVKISGIDMMTPYGYGRPH